MIESRRHALLWGALVIAFSPVLLDLASSLRAEPAQRTVLLAPLLMVLLLANTPDRRDQRPRPGRGRTLLLVGLAAQLLGVASGSWLIARLGLPIGLVGVALLTGRPDPRILLLAFGLVPIPDTLTHATSPGMESLLGRGAAEVLSLVGIRLEVGGPLFEYEGARFELQATDSGIVTASLLAEVGWYRAIRAQRDTWDAIGHAACWAAGTVAIQPLLVLLGVATLSIGASKEGRFLLTYGLALGLAAVVLLGALSGRLRSRAIGNESRTAS